MKILVKLGYKKTKKSKAAVKMKPLLKNYAVFVCSYPKAIGNHNFSSETQKSGQSHLPTKTSLSILLHLTVNVRKSKKVELTTCKLTHDQELDGGCLAQRQSRPHHLQGEEPEKSCPCPVCVLPKGLAANNC